MLSEGQFFDLVRQSMLIAVTISLPILGVALFVGLLIGLLQALTSIQEMTLTFVPKLAAIVIIFWSSIGFMTQKLTSFFQIQIIPIISGG